MTDLQVYLDIFVIKINPLNNLKHIKTPKET